MTPPRSSRVFAIVAIAAAGLASLKLIDTTEGVLDVLTLAEPAFAEGEAVEDPRGPLDILDADAHEAGSEDEHGADSAACPAEPGLAERSGLSLSELQVLRSLSQRRRDLDARESAIVERESLLDAAETRVADRIEELRDLEGRVEGLLGQLDEAEEERINALVGLYSRMKSDDAARIFASLDEDVLLDVASRMNEQALAPILADMSGSDAAALTVALARRHQAPSTLEALEAQGEPGG